MHTTAQPQKTFLWGSIPGIYCHNPLVPGSSPGGPTKNENTNLRAGYFLSVTLSNAGHAKKCVGNCYTLSMAMPLDFALRGCFSPEE